MTKDVLSSQYKGAEILEQVNIKMDGASMKADFVVIKDNNVLGVFESKVDGGTLSNGQKLFFNDGDDTSKVQTGVFSWDAKTGNFIAN